MNTNNNYLIYGNETQFIEGDEGLVLAIHKRLMIGELRL